MLIDVALVMQKNTWGVIMIIVIYVEEIILTFSKDVGISVTKNTFIIPLWRGIKQHDIIFWGQFWLLARHVRTISKEMRSACFTKLDHVATNIKLQCLRWNPSSRMTYQHWKLPTNIDNWWASCFALHSLVLTLFLRLVFPFSSLKNHVKCICQAF